MKPCLENPAGDLEGVRRESLALLQELLSDCTTVALVDVPRHPNFGDSLIWWGEEEYLRALGKKVVYRCSVYDYKKGDLSFVLRSDTTILFHGGGNLGDLYPHHDQLRRRVIRDFPKRRKIVLGQTLYCNDPVSWREEAALDYSRAMNVEVLLRDRPSLERAAEHLPGCRTTFCYDLALGSPVRRNGGGKSPILVLSRNDDEKNEVDVEGVNVEVQDWRAPKLARGLWKVTTALLDNVVAKNLSPRVRVAILNMALYGLARMNCWAAVGQVSGRSAVATDRLHAHVLCCLLGIRNYVADNNYGKISAVYAYTGALGSSVWCDDLNQAASLARSDLSWVKRLSA